MESEGALTTELSVLSQHIKGMGSPLSHEQLSSQLLNSLVRGVVARVSDAVARGNKKVFEEIGREFARFNTTCLADEVYKEETIQIFCKSLRPGLFTKSISLLLFVFHQSK